MLSKSGLFCWTSLLIALFLLVSCTAIVPPLNLEDSTVSQVWPAAPATPRVKLLRTLRGVDDLVEKKTKSKRLFGWLTGEMTEQIPLIAPYGVAADGKGLVWITDPGAHIVQRFDLARRRTDIISRVGDDQMQIPSGVAFDIKRDRLYVADSGTQRVYILSSDGKFLGEVGSSEIFGRPAGLALDEKGNLLVADVLRGLVLRFSPEGVELPSFGSSITDDGQFNRPLSVDVDSLGRIYVLDSLNFRIEVLDSAGHGLNTIGELGDVPGTFSRPRGLAVDSSGHIYVSDAAFDNIQIFDSQGQLLLIFGSGGKAGLSMPASLFVDSEDRIYAVDTYNHQLQIYQYLSVKPGG